MAKRSPRGAQNIDVHIGARLREARRTHQMSQTTLANQIGITFQQIQKYEKGTNRISAGRLYEVARLLELPITFFFNGFKLPKLPRHRRPARVAAG
jgi:transcriptional regulator with XRE-family HTH domain